jgi:TolA-binding protein
MKSLLLAFLCCTLAAFTLPSRASAEEADAPVASAEDEGEGEDAEVARLVKQLDAAKQRLDDAQRRLGELEGAKGRGAARRYPRGDAKAKYLEDLKQTRAEYEAARRALPDVVEDARRAGLPPGVLEPYEAAAEAASPVASADEDADYEASDEDDADAEDASDD